MMVGNMCPENEKKSRYILPYHLQVRILSHLDSCFGRASCCRAWANSCWKGERAQSGRG